MRSPLTPSLSGTGYPQGEVGRGKDEGDLAIRSRAQLGGHAPRVGPPAKGARTPAQEPAPYSSNAHVWRSKEFFFAYWLPTKQALGIMAWMPKV